MPDPQALHYALTHTPDTPGVGRLCQELLAHVTDLPIAPAPEQYRPASRHSPRVRASKTITICADGQSAVGQAANPATPHSKPQN